jgi:hypothetical protein
MPRPEFALDRQRYEIRDVSLTVATALVAEHHYAKGGPNTGVFRHGLFEVGAEEPLGVAWWLPPTKVAAQSVCENWRGVLSLTRLVVIPGMPTNAASFLLGASIRRVRRDGRWCHLVTYADEGQGHTGAIYRATNWHYAGTRPGDPVWVTEEGRQVARKSASKSRTAAEMEALGYRSLGRSRKHKFVMGVH